MGAGNAGTSNDSGGRDTKTPFGTASSTKTKDKFGYTKPKNKAVEFIKSGGVVGSVIRGFKNQSKASKQNLMDYEGAAAGVTKQRTNADAMREREAMQRNEGPDQNYKPPTTAEMESTGRANARSGYGPAVEIYGADGNRFVEGKINEGLKSPETNQSTAEDTEAARLLKIKKKGRSESIMNSSKGVTKTSLDYSLGKKSLLGRV
jgi:hypothetical protein